MDRKITEEQRKEWRAKNVEYLRELQDRGEEYEPPFGTSKAQPPEELDAVHDTWIGKLLADLPEGVPLLDDRWPATFGDRLPDGTIQHRVDEGQGYLFQCGNCCYCVTLEGSLGSDWGACSNPKSQYDGRVVFEHWTCKHFRHINLPPDKEDE